MSNTIKGFEVKQSIVTCYRLWHTYLQTNKQSKKNAFPWPLIQKLLRYLTKMLFYKQIYRQKIKWEVKSTSAKVTWFFLFYTENYSLIWIHSTRTKITLYQPFLGNDQLKIFRDTILGTVFSSVPLKKSDWIFSSIFCTHVTIKAMMYNKDNRNSNMS